MNTSTTESIRFAGLGALMKGVGKIMRFVPIPQPELLVGPGSSGQLGQAVAGSGHAKILIVTGGSLPRPGLMKPLTDALDAGGGPYLVFDEITPDAPLPLVEKGIELFRSSGCDAIVALGGGQSTQVAASTRWLLQGPAQSRTD